MQLTDVIWKRPHAMVYDEFKATALVCENMKRKTKIKRTAIQQAMRSRLTSQGGQQE
jgi:hypothetical protein